IPFVVPLAEIDGVAPGNPKLSGDSVEGELNTPVVVLKVNICTNVVPPPPIKYSLFCQNAGVEKFAVPALNRCTEPASPVPPRLSRFRRYNTPSFPTVTIKCAFGPLDGSSNTVAPPAPKSVSPTSRFA